MKHGNDRGPARPRPGPARPGPGPGPARPWPGPARLAPAAQDWHRPRKTQAWPRGTRRGQMMHPRTRKAEDLAMHALVSGSTPLATLSDRLKCRRGREFGTSFGHTSPGMTGQPKRGRRAATRGSCHAGAPATRGPATRRATNAARPSTPSSRLPIQTVSPAARGHLTFAGATEAPPGPSRHRFVRAVGRDY